MKHHSKKIRLLVLSAITVVCINVSYGQLDDPNWRPKTAEDFYTVGWALDSMREYKDAIRAYTKAIELKADYIAPYVNRGTAYKRLDQLAEALADYQKALALDPNYAE